jgi:hypothetical protein
LQRGFFCQGYAPIVDGPGGFLPEEPQVIRESGNYNQGNIITGICRDDGALYTAACTYTKASDLFGNYATVLALNSDPRS